MLFHTVFEVEITTRDRDCPVTKTAESQHFLIKGTVTWNCRV